MSTFTIEARSCQACGKALVRKYGEGALNWASRIACDRACAVDLRRGPSVIDRLLSRCVETAKGCWEFTGAKNAAGYGAISEGRKTLRAHRVTFEYFIADIPHGLFLDHLCRNRACVNPWHLDPVNNAVNVRRGISPAAMRARQTHCQHGHEFTAENTILSHGKWRTCRTCRDAYKRRHGRSSG